MLKMLMHILTYLLTCMHVIVITGTSRSVILGKKLQLFCFSGEYLSLGCC